MYRIAKQSLFLQMGEQLCHARPLLLLQRPVSQINVILPDCIRFYYADDNGSPSLREVDVQVIGENAHGVCFLTGVCNTPNRSATDSATDFATDDATNNATNKTSGAATEAFRMDLILGPITRLENGERLTLRDWERRVRRRFAMDCKTDALPLSSMLITAETDIADTRD